MSPAGQVTAGQPVDGPATPGPASAGPASAGPASTVGPGGPAARTVLLRHRADMLRAGRTPFVEATVVRAVRPTSAKAGDRALVLPDGTIEGFVGGTCAESSVRLHGLRVLRAQQPVMLRIVPEAPPPGSAGEPAAEGMVTVNNPCASGGLLEIFLEGVFPPPLVQVCGEAPIARALHTVGRALGYDIRATGPAGAIDPDAAAVVVASHGRDEEPVLTAALRAGVAYVGLVASRRRGAQVAASLGLPPDLVRRLHTPAGLDIGARTPEEIALSVFSEIISERGSAAGRASGGRGVKEPMEEHGAVTGGAAAKASPRPAEAGQARAGGLAGPAPEPEAGERAATHPPVAGAESGGETIDPVCGMTVAATRASPHLTHDGHMFFFCGPGCRQAFADDPARYQA